MNVQEKLAVKNNAIRLARTIVAWNPIFFDTETTGLDRNAELCDLGMIELDGEVVFDYLIKPKSRIPLEVSSIHGITNTMVRNANSFGYFWKRIKKLFDGRIVAGYNVGFDIRILTQSANFARIKNTNLTYTMVVDIMQIYSKFYGEYDSKFRSFRWQKLEKAAVQCGLHFGTLHRAAIDADLTRRLLIYMTTIEME